MSIRHAHDDIVTARHVTPAFLLVNTAYGLASRCDGMENPHFKSKYGLAETG